MLVLVTACGDDSTSDVAGTVSTPPAPAAATVPAPAPTTPGATTAPPVTAPPEATPAPIQVGPFEVTTADGLILEAERFGTGTDFVVLAHMRPSDMSSWFSFAGFLAGEGYTAITFNFRGYGNSEGSGFAVDVDVAAAVDVALALGAERVFVIGASMGGTGSVVAASQRDVAGVVTLSAPARFEGADAVAAATTVTAPMLLIAAEDDGPYAADAASISAAAGGATTVEILSGRNHGTDLFREHSEELTARILVFLGGRDPLSLIGY